MTVEDYMNNREIDTFIVYANNGYGYKIVYDTRKTPLEPNKFIRNSIIENMTIDKDIVIIEI